jgi:hypothetical protein
MISAASQLLSPTNLCAMSPTADDSARSGKGIRNAKMEVESALRRTETGRYLVEACKSDPELAEAVESGYASGVPPLILANDQRRLWRCDL